MTIWQTQQTITNKTKVYGDMTVGALARHITRGFTYPLFNDDELRDQVVNDIHSAVKKIRERQMYGDGANLIDTGDIMALRLLALINEANSELNAIWSLDNSEDVETCKKRERNVRSRLRRAEHKFYGRSLNMINHI